MTTKRALITWLAMIPVAIANGTLRQFGYARYVGDGAAHQISSTCEECRHRARTSVRTRQRLCAALVELVK